MVQSRKKANWQVWWRLLRPHTLTAAFVPVSVGTALALQEGQVNLPLFLAMLLASLIIQAATNMFNEYFDYVKGLDTAESVGIGGTIVRDGVPASTVLNIALAFYGVAIILGFYICAASSWWLAAVGLACMAAGYLYTGGPWPIAYTPLGEILSGVLMGMTIILISFFIQTGTVSLESVLISVPITVLIGNIMLSNNIRDLDGDRDKGRHTVPILLGRDNAITLLAIVFTFAFLWLTGLVLLKIVTPWSLLALGSIPKARLAVLGFRGKSLAVEMMPAMQATAQTNTIFGLLLAAGLTLGYWF
ncbi:1,4-dihydroxy-2-naphthoate octaprenyltransferase [Sporotomaculum syntrophicum]|uniref:1,4-dihydroxy-2-naphthoate octaprenyltransferase n=1 Tax=Sporotomaculum syntrophicum TaxID=182264 RepID=A0A9D2WLW3_9FIRM|nr:1,4-dihydroxy-2-naphthoate polyprenyltransferase [Sporotomaculum syntrophicum]KAF1083852.1 1,4-dihydroxy-2-naphthoate octaprenyltransferase [Sporotomaculum syntrophicum]